MSDRELLVRINMDHAPGRMELLTPGGSLRWGRCRFDFNPEPGGRADFAVVMGNARPVDRFMVAPENTLFIAAEPPTKKVYPKAFYHQFSHIVDTHALSGHSAVEVTTPGLCWHAGLDRRTNSFHYGYDHLKSLPVPEKINRVSVVCSDAAFTPGQRLRLDFLHRLKAKLGERLVHYGRGFEPIDDKMTAILPNRFHLVMENCELPNYWTEKLSDAYLGWAFPFYVGCPNLTDFFPQNEFLRLDPRNVDEAASLMIRMLDTESTYEETSVIDSARRRILDTYNPFAWCARWVEKFHHDASEKKVIIRSHKAFRAFPRGMIYRLRHL